jgi:hypothetical protein
MFHKLIETIKQAGHQTSFDGYMSQLQRGRTVGHVTYKEAQKDYQRLIYSDTHYRIG